MISLKSKKREKNIHIKKNVLKIYNELFKNIVTYKPPIFFSE